MLELMLRAVVIGGLLTVAAMLLERGLVHLRAGTRYAWTVALIATALAPFMPRLMPTSVEVMPVMQMPAMVVDATLDAGSRVPINLLVIWWLLLSVAVLAAHAIAYARLVHAKQTWQPARIAQTDVFMSDGFGPAVFGFLAPRIVVPRWIRDTPAEEQELIVLHEREHIRAGDQAQLLLAIAATVLMPWNPFTWWQARRLRFTIETDCDQRVLVSAPDRRRYASLLVHVGSRQSGLLLTPALAEHRNGLEARVNMLTKKFVRNVWKAAGLIVVGLVVVFVACESRLPQDPAKSQEAIVQNVQARKDSATEYLRASREPDYIGTTRDKVPEPLPAGTKRKSRIDIPEPGPANLQSLPRKVPDGQPHFTPFTKQPELKNREVVVSLMANHYPPLLRDAGIGGQTIAWALVDERGRVVSTRVTGSAGHAALDSAALRVVRRMEFIPAEHEGTRVPVWIALPIVFKAQ
jgi:TonB family protein